MRAMTASDNDLLRSFFQHLSPSARYRRFMSPMRQVPDAILERLSIVDQSSHVAYLVETLVDDRPTMIAEARYVVEQAKSHVCEFAIAVADGWQGQGIGIRLLGLLEQHAVQSGGRKMVADTLPDNGAMIRLAKRCGYSVGRNQHDVRVKRLTKQVTVH